MVKQEKFGRICKERMIDEIVSRFEKRPNFIVTNYMGLSNQELELLRRSLRKTSSSYFVVKNAILKIVFDKLKLEGPNQAVDGGVGISLSGEDVISTCRALVNFAKEHNKLQIKTAVFDGKGISLERIKELASLPTREVLLARVVGGIKSPITGFVNVLSGVLRKFVYVVDAIKTKKGQSSIEGEEKDGSKGN